MQRSPEAQRIREEYECVLVSQPWKMSVACYCSYFSQEFDFMLFLWLDMASEEMVDAADL